jgi:arylsulfatase A-like enzyme
VPKPAFRRDLAAQAFGNCVASRKSLRNSNSFERLVSIWLVVAATGCGHIHGAAAASPLLPRPNIVFILADDLGYGDLGCYGQKLIRTPELDRLATEGTRFTQCYAGSTTSAASRDALMTGRHTGHTTLRGNRKVPLRTEDVTVAEIVKRAGYRTAAIGKWGLGGDGTTGAPNRQGFEEWFGYLDLAEAQNYYPETIWRNDYRFVLEKNLQGKQGDYSHDWFTRTSGNFICSNTNRSFFLYLAYTIPHANLALGRTTGNGMQVPNDEPYSKEPWPQPEKNKAAMITRLDRDVGQLMRLLRQLKIETNTLVFFSSDGGPHRDGGVNPGFFASAGSLRGIKRDLYEGGIRVPMIVRWPGRVPAGVANDEPWAFWDLLPTVAELVAIKPPTGIDGLSVLPRLLGREPERRHEFFYWESHERGFRQAVRTGDWKALRLGIDRPFELYNLKSDPGETNNLASSQPLVVDRIEAYLKTARTESKYWPVKPAAKPASNPPAP